MRSSPITAFQETVSRCFANVLETMLGRAVRVTILEILESNGVPPNEIAEKFEQAFEVLAKSFGTGSRVVEHRTMVEVYHEYCQRVDFGFFDKLEDRLSALRYRVTNKGLYPATSNLEDRAK